MYYKHFGLTQPPFRITPDTDFFFEGGNRGAILEALTYAITQGEGIIKVVGEVGSGKTMLCRVLQSRLPNTVETVYLANPSVSPEEILHAIAFELELPLARDAGRLEVMHALNEYLLTRHEEGRQVVVFVEESQSMPIATLEEIRLLSNLETRQHKLLQIILFGQPELDENLRKPEIRQLRDRITNSFALTPLTQAEVKDYVSFRLRAAGYHGPDLFPPQVIRYIWKETGGLTRRINIVADKALLAAYAANTHNVSLGHVQAAVADSAFSNAGRPAGAAWAKWAVAVLAAVMLAAVVGAGLDHYLSSATPSRSREAAHWSPSPNLPAPAAAAALPTAPSPSAQVAVTDPGSPDAAPVPRPQAATPAGASNQAPVPATNRGSRGDGNLLEQRLLATERWLAEERGGVFSIQLLGSNDAQMLRSYLDTLSNYIEKDKIFVYRTVANREPSMTVLYGAFPARADAVKSMEALPPALKANRPYIRTVQGIRAELALTKSSSRERDSMATDTGKKYRAVALTQASGPRG